MMASRLQMWLGTWLTWSRGERQERSRRNLHAREPSEIESSRCNPSHAPRNYTGSGQHCRTERRAGCGNTEEHGQERRCYKNRELGLCGGGAVADNYDGDSGEGAIDCGAVDIVVGDHANAEFSCGTAQDIALCKVVADFGGGASRFMDVEDEDVGDDFCGIDGDAVDARETRCQMVCILMIEMQDFRSFLERDQSGGCENASLAHASAEKLACDASVLDEIARADEHGANRRAESFR